MIIAVAILRGGVNPMVYDAKQLYSFIKTRGYTKTNDALGTYFDKGNNRMSIMKQGSWYICYHNQRHGASWIPVNKSTTFSDFGEAMHWIATQISKI
jgi:hypothetical protein